MNWNKLRDKYFKECVGEVNHCGEGFRGETIRKLDVTYAPHDLFEWFKREVQAVALPVKEEPKAKEVYCIDCGSENLSYIEQYACGKHYRCNECGKEICDGTVNRITGI